MKGGMNKMAFQPEKPRYVGSGVSIWVVKDKNGKEFMKCKILGSSIVNCFLNEEKEEKE